MATVSNRNLWIDYLRSFLTVLVVAHHTSLAYTTFAYFNTPAYISSTAPVVDASRWIGMDIFENFNDIFFMSLLFLISGLFFYRSWYKKGTKQFLYDRFKRLGIPFTLAVTFIIPVAYIPSYYLVHYGFNILPFIKDYIIVEQWPVGPPWFIWILLLFNIVAVFIPASFYITVNKAIAKLVQKPALFFFVFFIIVSMAFIPLSLWIGQYTWTGFGPFDFQLNRIFLYFVFFLFGACLGSGEWERHLFTNNRLLNKRRTFWIITCIAVYLIVELISSFGPGIVRGYAISSNVAYFIFDLFFVASCITSCLAFLSFFRQRINKPYLLWTNLSANAFGIYLVHYVFVTWFQFALLNISLPVAVKFLLVFSGALTTSWLITNQARKYKVINQLL